MPSQLAPVHRRRHEGAEMLPAVADATAPPLAAPAGHFLGSRGPRASAEVAWREDADALPTSGAPGEDMDPASWPATARRDEIAPPRWHVSPYRDELRAPGRSCPPSSVRRKSSGGSSPAPPDRSSAPHLRIEVRGKGSTRRLVRPQTIQRIQKLPRSRGRTHNRAITGVVIAFPPSDGEPDGVNWEP